MGPRQQAVGSWRRGRGVQARCRGLATLGTWSTGPGTLRRGHFGIRYLHQGNGSKRVTQPVMRAAATSQIKHEPCICTG